jgi:dUTP pyrophosphatase
MVAVRLRRLPHGQGLELPRYASAGAAGADVCAAEAVPHLAPGERVAVATGFALEVPVGFEVQVRPRSGLALNYGLTVLNAPGTVDSDYRGEVKVILVNLGREAVAIARGERIAQLVVAPITRAAFTEVAELAASDRGGGGFGSTGA